MLSHPLNKPSRIMSLAVLLLAMIICGLIALYLGKELGWDLANYHYYNPYAFFHNRWEIDYWPPSNLPIYLNPTADFLTYFLITYMPVWAAVFILGAIHGMNVWLLFLLSYRFTIRYDYQYATCMAIILAVVGMYGPVSFSEIGSFMGDNLNSIFILTAFLFQVIYLQTLTDSKSSFIFLSGLALGIAVGLKFTAVVFVIGFLFSNLIINIPISKKIKLIGFWFFAFILGLIIASGYWMFFLWQHYHNPFFPFFNRLFQASDFPPINWYDVRFLPKTTLQSLFYPFFFSWNGQTTDLPFIDYRFPILYTGLIATVVVWFYKKIHHPKNTLVDIVWRWLILCCVFTYIAWQVNSSNLRYLVALQLLIPLLLYLIGCYLFKDSIIRARVLSCSLLLIVLSMSYMAHTRNHQFKQSYFNVVLPEHVATQRNAFVLIAFSNLTLTSQPWPLAYLIPYFPHDWQFVGVPFNGTQEYFLPDKVKSLVKNHSEDIYLLASQETIPLFYLAAAELGLKKSGECEKIFTERDPGTALLCPVLRCASN